MIQTLPRVGYFQILTLVLKDSSSTPASKGFFLAVCDPQPRSNLSQDRLAQDGV